MEKFSNWRDKGTGIAPFLPPPVPASSKVSVVLNVAWYSVKMVLLLPIMALVMVTGDKFWHRFIYRVLYGLREEIVVVGVKKREVVPWKHYPLRNNVYVCNSSSPWDVLLLGLIAEGPAMFLVPNAGTLYRMNADQYYSYALAGSLDAKLFGKEITSFNDCRGYVCFMFLEGTCSNGKSVLPFEITSKQLGEFLYGKDENDVPVKERINIFTVQLRLNSSIVTPLAIGRREFFLRSIIKSVKAKIKISHEPYSAKNLDSIRAKLMDDDKYKLVSKSLGIEAKRKFVSEFNKKHKL